jgi:hypothetical protein
MSLCSAPLESDLGEVHLGLKAKFLGMVGCTE